MIKCFTWAERDREDVTLGSSTRINPKTHRAQLEADGSGLFSTAADLFVTSRLWSPQAVRGWAGFEALVIHPKDDLGADITLVGFRLDDGTGELYWDGGAWSAAGPGNWSTEQEIADNIATFPTTERALKVVVNLATPDETLTPELAWVKVLWDAQIEFQEDIVYRSLIPLLRAEIRPISRVVVAMPATGTTLNVSDFALESGYDVVDIDAVFDFDADSDAARAGYAADLLSSYDGGTKEITLTGSVTAGTNLWIRFVYAPTVARNTSQDYVDAEFVPALVVDDVEAVDMAELPAATDHVANKGTLVAIVVPSPEQGNLSMKLIGAADKGVDHQRLLEAVNRFFRNNPFVISTGLDERYRMQLIDEYAEVGEPGQDEIHVGEATLQIRNFRQWLKDAVAGFIIDTSLKTTSGSDIQLSG